MPQATKNLVHALTNVITAIVARPGRLDWLVVNVESIGTFLSKPTQQLRSKVFRLQMDVWGLSGLSTSRRGGVSDVKHTAPPGMIQVRSN